MHARSRSHRPLAIAIAIGLTCAAGGAAGATITVNRPGDDNSVSTMCNLRDAIASVNAGIVTASCALTTSGTLGTEDAIVFAPALADSTITLAQGQLSISKPVTITGSGQTIDAHQASRVMYTKTDLDLSHVTLTGGTANHGGGLYLYDNSGSHVKLTNVTVVGNDSSGSGGGIYLYGGHVELLSSHVTSNTSSTGGAGLGVNGGAYLVMSNTTVLGNALTGAGVNVSGAGGMEIRTANSAIIVSSTIAGNSATSGVAQSVVIGGVLSMTSPVRLINSTVSDNSASGTDQTAGGLMDFHFNQFPCVNCGLTLTNSTVSSNTATTANGSATHTVGGILVGTSSTPGFPTGNVMLANTVVAGNSASGGSAVAADIGIDPQNSPTLNIDYSLVGSALDVAPYNLAHHNVFTDAPRLAPLHNYGGMTQTRALLAGSPAIDAGSNALALDAEAQPLTSDQTGAARKVNGTVDIGAVEYTGDELFADSFGG